MIGIAAHEDHAARHHLQRIDVGDREAQHLRVEPHGALEVADVEHDMAELGDAKRHTNGTLQALEIGNFAPPRPPCRRL